MGHSLHVFFSPIQNESRLDKITKSLINLAIVDRVTIIGFWLPHLKKKEKVDENRTIVRINFPVKNKKYTSFFTKKPIALYSHIYFTISVIIQILKVKPSYISCHNLHLLPLSWLGKMLVNSKLIYEPHELETEKTGLNKNLKPFFKIIERIFIKGADKIIVVSEPIKDWYSETYKLENIDVIRNVPFNEFLNQPFSKSNVLREELGIDLNEIIVIYQGVIDKSRGIQELIEVFKLIPKSIHLVLMGYGDMIDMVIKESKQSPNIHYREAVKIKEIIKYTSGADYGIFYVPFDISLSYQYSLPNKFFEYILAGLPVIVNENLKYLSFLIAENKLGFVVNSDNKKLINLIKNLSKIHKFGQNIEKFRKLHGWEIEEKILVNTYE